MPVTSSRLFTKPYLTTNIDQADILFLVDVYNFAFRQATARKWSVIPDGPRKGLATGHVFGAIQSLSAKLRDFAINETKTACLVFCLDGRPVDKYQAFPGYKKGRGTRTALGYDPTTDVIHVLSFIPSVFAGEPASEADDVIATLVEQYHKKTECLVLTTDQDMWALADRARVLTFKDKVVAQEDLWNDFGTKEGEACKIPIVKAIYGDKSDKIAKIPLPRKAWDDIAVVLNACDGTIESFYGQLAAQSISNEVRLALLTSREQVEAMYGITQLNYAVKYKLTVNEGSLDLLQKVLVEFEIKTLDKSAQRFFGTYE